MWVIGVKGLWITRSRGVLLEPREQPIEDALASDLAFGSGVITLSLKRRQELD